MRKNKTNNTLLLKRKSLHSICYLTFPAHILYVNTCFATIYKYLLDIVLTISVKRKCKNLKEMSTFLYYYFFMLFQRGY